MAATTCNQRRMRLAHSVTMDSHIIVSFNFSLRPGMDKLDVMAGI
jgi:hypothetical protein